jgi:SPP1 gp7 family putative phage head morphogenesis protein
MAQTANEEFRDALIRRQIGILGLSSTVAAGLIKILNSDETHLRRMIEKHVFKFADEDGFRFNRKVETNLRNLTKEMLELRNASFSEVRKQLDDVLKELMVRESKFMVGATRTVLPVEVEPQTPLTALFVTALGVSAVQGRTLRTWIKEAAQKDVGRIMAGVRIGLAQGENMNSLMIRAFGRSSLSGRDGATNTTRNHLNWLTRTSMLHFSNYARSEFYSENEVLIDKEQYVATLDDRTTTICASLDGKIFAIGVGPHPPLHFNCRSIRVGYFDDQVVGLRPAKQTTEKSILRDYAKQEGLGSVPKHRNQIPFGHKTSFDLFRRTRIRQMTGPIPASTTYTDFLKGQSAEFQDDVLGQAKGKLFRDGKLPLDRFVDPRGKDYTLAQLARRDRQAFIAAGLDPEDFL